MQPELIIDTMRPVQKKSAAVLVVGGGIGGMRAALDLADAGLKVYLVEQTPCLGGRVAQLGFMFPQHDCVLCRGTPDHGYGCTRPSISPAYIHHNQHPNIEILTSTRVVDVEGQGAPVQCQHCEDAACVAVCPTEALSWDEQTGAVRLDGDKGVGCRACIIACPFGAIEWHEGSESVVKCDLCVGIVGDGEEPCCVAACPSGALRFGRFDEPDSQ